MENFTGVCDPKVLLAALTNSTNGNLTSPCDIVTDVVDEVIDDSLYWEQTLPGFILLYVKEVYGEFYKLVFYVSLAVCIIGYVTNTFNVVVLSSTPMAHSMNLFLLVLSAADMFHITTQFSHILHYLLGFPLFPSYGWVVFYIWNTYFETLFLYATNWLAVSIGAWRFIVVTWPLHSREWCSKGRAKLVIVVIFVASAVLASPVFVVMTYSKITVHSMDLYDKGFSELATRNNQAILKTYWVLLLFMGFVPCLILAVLTFGLFRSLYVARAKRRSIADNRRNAVAVGSHRTTVMLTIILIFYILSNFPDGCLYFIALVTDADNETQQRTRHYTDIVRIFMLSNNSSGFFIYYGLGEGFRTRFHRAFCCCVYGNISRERDESAKTTSSDLNRSRTNSSDGHRPSLSENEVNGPTTVL